jgi:asparagine synthetase B (glutamine-hydrolysing)
MRRNVIEYDYGSRYERFENPREVRGLPLMPFFGIEAVEAGCIVQFRGTSAPSHHRWFAIERLVDPELHRELDRAAQPDVLERLDATFQTSLAYRMVSDVPVASLVSGGVDSSLVTVLASRTEHPPELYHADVVADTERPAAEAVAAHVGRRLHMARVTDSSFLSQVSRATWFNDAPLTYHVNAVPFLSNEAFALLPDPRARKRILGEVAGQVLIRFLQGPGDLAASADS